MRWASSVSDAASLTQAVQFASEQTLENLEGERADAVLAFISAHHAPSYLTMPELVRSAFGNAPFIGCAAGGVIGGGHEVENRPGVAIVAAHLPGVRVNAFYLTQDSLPNADASPNAWEDAVGASAAENPHFVLLPDPFSINAEAVIAGLDFAFPGSVKIGGLASGGRQAGENTLFLNDRSIRRGAVGLALSGDLTVETVVAQGCRPIGRPMVVTECDRNLIRRVGDKAPMEVVRELFEAAHERDRRLIRRSLHVGIVMDPLSDTFSAGDFLIRNVIGVEEQTGAVAISEIVREGQVVQFHVRDAATATEDLSQVLERYVFRHGRRRPSGALLFSCLGRGQYLFGAPDHDTELFQSMVAPLPLAGFFCNGEIGPVGNTTFLHGYTSSFALFSPRQPEPAA
ncbi:MAG: FIST C-terminal domain-containing protein [Chloroflexi bacterium]|nr:FIST C-terminal domain-containing protein [Chloroflexota bacterium]